MAAGYDAALIIVGHGSAVRAGAGRPTLALVDAVRKVGCYAAVEGAFLKGKPGIAAVLAAVPRDRPVRVIPHFASSGRLVRQALPAAILADGHRRVLSVTPAIGEHPDFAAGVRRAVEVLGSTLGSRPDLLVIGHGTARPGDRPGRPMMLTTALQYGGYQGPVGEVYLEQPPFLSDWASMGPGRDVLMVSLLAGAGLHGREQLSRCLGLAAQQEDALTNGRIVGPLTRGERRLWVMAPLTDIALLTAVLVADLARQEPERTGRHLDHNQGCQAGSHYHQPWRTGLPASGQGWPDS